MENSSGRFLIKIHHYPLPLACQAEGVLVKLFQFVPRLKTNVIRNWAMANIPALIRESLIRRVTLEWEGVADKKQVVQKVWSVLFSHHMVTIEVLPHLDETTRHTIVSYFGSDHKKHTTTPLTVLRTMIQVTELPSVVNIIQYSPALVEVQIRRGATDDLLGLLGATCPFLKEVNFTCSTKVTDVGISQLLHDNNALLNPCHSSLTYAKLRGTRVRREGVRLLLRSCLNLEGIRCNTKDVMQALSSFFKEDKQRVDGTLLSLKYMDFSSCFALFAERLDQMPTLMEVRIGADVPPQLKSFSQKHRAEVIVPTEQMRQALKYLNLLSGLRCLVLKDVSNDEVELALSVCGKKLKRLDIHYMPNGIDLDMINKNAHSLIDLSISDSKILQMRESQSCKKFLPYLEVCKLMRVSYRDNSETEVIRKCPNLRILHQEAGSGITDDLIEELKENKQLSKLEEIVINGDCQLGTKSVRTLMELPLLNRIGDIQDWKISQAGRKRFFMCLAGQWERKMGYTRKVAVDE